MSKPNRWKGFVLGVVGAVPAMIAMDSFWKVVYRLQSSSSSDGGSSGNQSSRQSESSQSSQAGQSTQSNQSASSAGQSQQGGAQVATQASPETSSQSASPSQHSQKWRQTHHILSPFGRHFKEGESSTAAMGSLVYKWITGREPQSQETVTLLSNLTDWSFGMLMGGLFGIFRSESKIFDIKAELIYSTGLWLTTDEIGVPLAGLSWGPRAYPLSSHLESLGAHIVYGVVMSTTTKLLDRIL